MPSLIRISTSDLAARRAGKCKFFSKKYGKKCKKCVCSKSNPILNRIKSRSKYLGPVVEGMYRNCAKGCRQAAFKYRSDSAARIQSKFRGNRQRFKYRVQKASAVRIQSAARRYLANRRTGRIRLDSYRKRLSRL
jgi:hypothetical protein